MRPAAAELSVDEIARWIGRLGRGGAPTADAGRIDVVAALERLKSAAAAAQARVTAAFAGSQAAAAPPGTDRAEVERSVAAQIGLARRTSPVRGRAAVGLARMLAGDLPETGAALATGEISEWQATLVAREVAVLDVAGRAQADRELAGRLGPMGDRRVAIEARRIADRLDGEAAIRRLSGAESERRVSIRPVRDGMVQVTGLLPLVQGVGLYAALRAHAIGARNAGDRRGVGQIMADELCARVASRGPASGHGSTSGQDPVSGRGPDGDAGLGLGPGSTPSRARSVPDPPGVPDVSVGLIMTERTLLRGGRDAATVVGPDGVHYGTVPAFLARRLVRRADRAWLRRLYARPESGELVAADARVRRFSGRMRDLVVWRDQTCRTAWCEAPIRHVDHIRSYATGGATALENAQGLCESCNYAKESAGWHADLVPVDGSAGTGNLIELTTPTGHRYPSAAPPQPGHPPPQGDHRLRDLLDDVADHADRVA